MNEFFLYEQLCAMEDIAKQYGEGRRHCQAIRQTAEQISTRTYRVAVIGEFKRGKSSLINALVGAEVLPTDILPMTATVTRMIYGIERQITIHYRDGRQEERTLEELFDFATKFDKQKEQTALSVREIVVRFPSVICKNHIEILDTPGLNDNESMSSVTLGVIGEVDAAIMVISAREPLSISEQKLILDLIAQPGIRHVIFVVTFIDAFRKEEEKDKILSFIRSRLENEVIQRAESAFADRPELMEKARTILLGKERKGPDMFGVSSRQAMDGFINDDEELLEESRFPKFKEDLLALLTAMQSADLPPKTMVMAELVAGELPKWKQAQDQALGQQERELSALLKAQKDLVDTSRKGLMDLLQEMDRRLMQKRQGDMSPEGIKRRCLRGFVKELSGLSAKTISDQAVRSALENGKTSAEDMFLSVQAQLRQWTQEEMGNVMDRFRAERCGAGLTDVELDQKLQGWTAEFPAFAWSEEPIPNGPLAGRDVMQTVRIAVNDSVAAFENAYKRFIGSWRVILMKQNGEDIGTVSADDGPRQQLQQLQMKRSALQYNFSQHIRELSEMIQQLKEEAF